MENRQAHRLYTNLAIECRAVLQDQGSTFATPAMMKNISRGGAYLECDTEPQLFQGEIGHFTFSAPAGQPEWETFVWPPKPGSAALTASTEAGPLSAWRWSSFPAP